MQLVPQEARSEDSSLTDRILYWSLRAFTFLVALELGFLIIAAFVWIPFYAAEGYSVQFEDRILGLVSACLLFFSIIIPHRWTLRGPAFIFRVAMITIGISSTIAVDLIAFKRGLSITPFTVAGYLALLVGAALLITLKFERQSESNLRTLLLTLVVVTSFSLAADSNALLPPGVDSMSFRSF